MLKKMMKKISSGITAALMCFSVMSALPAAVINVAAEGSTNMDLGAPAHEKTLESNGDGTYNLSLTVKGESKASSDKTKADVIVVFDASSSMDDNRLSIGKKAIKDLAVELFKNNMDPDDIAIQMSLIKFGSLATTVIGGTSDKNTFLNSVDSLNKYSYDNNYDENYGGTNWEAALKLASEIQPRENSETHIIFVSDGSPTFRLTPYGEDNYKDTWSGWGRKYPWYGNGLDDKSQYNYKAALEYAKKIVSSNKQLYTVNVFENTKNQNMVNLVNQAYGINNLTGHAFYAQKADELKNAFNDIIQQINHSSTYQNVTIYDPLTPETGIIPEFTYTVTNKEGVVVNDGLKLTDGSNTILPEAYYDSEKHTVTWDLGRNYKLPDGYTFKVSFEVFPTQTTADTIAEFKNGKIAYSKEKFPNIVKNNDKYQVYSNTTDAKVKYHVVKDDSVGNEKTTSYERPLMDVDPVLVHLTKTWDDSLDTSVRPDSIAFEVKQDGNVIDTITLSKDNWTRDYYLAAGIVKSDGTIRTSGHLYTFEEKLSEADSKKYEVTSASTQPMYVGGTLKEAKTSPYVDFDSDHNVSVGTNTLKGRLEIKKEVYTPEGSAPAPADTEFTISVTLNKNGEQIPSKYNVYNAEGKRTVTGSTTTEGTKEIKLKNGESVVFDNLDTGTTYTVQETNIPNGYTNRSIIYDNENKVITANHKDVVTVVNDYFSITAKKVWSDSNNQDGKRARVIFKLQSSTDGTKWSDVANSERAIGTTDNESAAWTGYPAKDSNDHSLKYQVIEDGVPSGYTSAISGSGDNYKITNTYTPETIKISGTKIWNDANNQDGKRAKFITVKLMDGDKVIESKTVTADNNWKYEFSPVPKYREGKEITYTVSEDGVPAGYTPTVDGFDITNTYKPETTSITVTKTWDDANNQDGKRPESITVRLLANDVEKESATITATDNWKHEFTDLPVYEGGNKISYTVTEDAINVDGYSSKIDGYNITNSYTPELTEVKGQKTWDDANNQDGKRPEKITVRLLADGKEVASKEVSAKDGWAYAFDNLPKYASGKEIAYTVAEDAVTDYTSNADGYNLTNSHTPEKIAVAGEKTWNDTDNQDGIRPNSITVNLLADGKVKETKTVTANDNWKYSFADLDKYANGHEIVYTVTEEAVAGYISTINGYNVTNSHTPETIDIKGSKVWADGNNQDGIRPEYIKVNLFADGKKVAEQTVKGEGSSWTYSFTGMPKNANGKQIVYTVTEEAVTNYTTSIDGLTITNTHVPEKTEVIGTKTWYDSDNQDGKRPEKITVRLLADDKEVTSKEVAGGKENNSWTYVFKDLPKYANGTEIVYSVTEDAVADYETSINGYNIKNTHTPEKTEVNGTKTWDDGNNQDGKRPTSIHVNLLANGSKVAEKDVTEIDNWSYTFANLPKYANGTEIVYSVTEEAVEGYTPTINGSNITNKYEPEKTSVNGVKIWDDGNNQDGKRPGSITVNLLANGTQVDSKVVTDTDNWSYTFADLPKYADGTEIVYTVTEDAVADYEISINGYNIKNTHTPEKTEISGTKTWNDENNKDGKRPTSIHVNLLANGSKVDEKDVTEADNWTYTFANLPKYANGTEITYTVTEDKVEGYTTEVIGTSLINYHTPEMLEISGKKTWDDANNQDGKRPGSITVNLLANGTKIASKEVTEADNWSYAFTDLPKYANTQEIIYTVTEDQVEGYATEITGYDIKNSHTPDKYKEIIGHKEWTDGNDVDGKRPDHITVRLLANGKEVANQEVTGPDWNFRFENLDKNKEGKPITYTVTEDAVEGYTTEITGDVEKGYTISNTHEPETIAKISGTKTWNDNNNQDNKRPESITVRLYADGTEVASTTTDEQHSWYYEFTNLKKYREGEKGQEIEYTVKEDEVEGYTSTIDGYNITNTHELETMNISGEKVWDDADNQDGKRPESIIVHLYANGEEERTQTVTAENNWKFSFENLYKYRNGNPIRYSVVEEYVEGYEIGTVTGNAEDGFVITNKRTPELINRISGTKTWDDNNNQDGKRPESITVRLLADGEEVDSQTVTAANDWNYEFTNLPKYSNGKEITYTVTEDDVNGYTATVEGYNITNTHTPETVGINGQKVWNDNNNAGNTRPESITVQLYANGVKVAETTANKDLEWFFSFGELPVYENGEKITYTVTETPVEGYRSSVSGDAVNGFTVRNTLRPQTPTTDDKEPTIKPATPTPTKRRPQTPFTADTSNVALYGGLTLVALAAVIGILIRRREN